MTRRTIWAAHARLAGLSNFGRQSTSPLWSLDQMVLKAACDQENNLCNTCAPQDLAAWLAEHSPALDALTPPLPPSPDVAPFEQRQQQLAQAAAAATEGARHRGLAERLADLLDSGRADEQEDYWWVALAALGMALAALVWHLLR